MRGFSLGRFGLERPADWARLVGVLVVLSRCMGRERIMRRTFVSHGSRRIWRGAWLRRLALVVFALAAVLVVGGGSATAATTTIVVGDGTTPSIAPPHWVSDDGRYVVFNGTGGLTLRDTVGATATIIPGAPVAGAHGERGRSLRRLPERLGPSDAVGSHDSNERARQPHRRCQQPALADFYGVTVSGNGRYVAFLSCDPVLQPPSGCGSFDAGEGIYLRDRVAGTTVPVTVTPGGSARSSSVALSLSDDGSIAAWSGHMLTGPDAGVSAVIVSLELRHEQPQRDRG